MIERNHAIKLTIALYKVSDFFPEKEPLKMLIRKKADEVLAGLIFLEKSDSLREQVASDIEVIKAFFELAKEQNWVDKKNFEILEKAYNGVLEAIKLKPIESKEKEIRFAQKEKKVERLENDLDVGKKRCSGIIEVLKQRKEIQVQDLKDVFPDVSKRTLRRDFEYLLAKGIVERKGDNNNTFYKLR